MDNGIWSALLAYLARASRVVDHPGLRFLLVIAGFISAFLLMFVSVMGKDANQPAIIGAFSILFLVLLLLGGDVLRQDRLERRLDRERSINEETKKRLRNRVQEEKEDEKKREQRD